MSKNVTSQPQIDPREFQEFGYLQEANRLFFHPLGLALGIARIEAVDGDPREGTEWRFVVFDSRDDPEGVNFQGIDLLPKAERVAQEWYRRGEIRCSVLGYQIQPAEPESSK
jgi:hypothetical protein